MEVSIILGSFSVGLKSWDLLFLYKMYLSYD